MKNKFAERLKELRLEKKATQQEVSLETKISQASIARMERGKQQPSIDALVALAVYFKTSIDYLAGLKDTEN